VKYLSHLLGFFSLVLSGCASAPSEPPQASSWTDQCYLEFEHDVSAIAGETAIDCGFLSRQASKGDRAATKTCANRAVKSGKPFKFGYAGGRDSFICDVAIRQMDGQLVSVFVESYVSIPPDPDSSGPYVHTSRCNKIKFEPGYIYPQSFFDLQDCTVASEIFDALSSDRK